MSELDQIREKINHIDEEMAHLFEKRMEMSAQVAAFKKDRGLSVRDAERERELIERSAGYISNEAVGSYYTQFLRDVIGLSCAYQSRLMEGMQVAYCGAEGAYAYIAARRMFPEARLVSYPDFVAAYRAVERGEADSVVGYRDGSAVLRRAVHQSGAGPGYFPQPAGSGECHGGHGENRGQPSAGPAPVR